MLVLNLPVTVAPVTDIVLENVAEDQEVELHEDFVPQVLPDVVRDHHSVLADPVLREVGQDLPSALDLVPEVPDVDRGLHFLVISLILRTLFTIARNLQRDLLSLHPEVPDVAQDPPPTPANPLYTALLQNNAQLFHYSVNTFKVHTNSTNGDR